MRWYIERGHHQVVLDNGTTMKARLIEIEDAVDIAVDDDSYIINEASAEASIVGDIIRVVNRPPRGSTS